MPKKDDNNSIEHLSSWGTILLGIPWPEILGQLWKIGRKVIRGLSNEGIYEVLDYETILELHDKMGKTATLRKREKVKYLQDHILAYQEQAWGDGRILVNYRCSPGKPVDRYRSGYKTHILISLQEVKNKGEIDEFNIQWDIRRGFLLPNGFWGTEINHRTRQIKVHVIFPKTRSPLRSWIQEKNLQRTQVLGESSVKKLPDGRWQLTWEKHKPRLYEQYILNWEW